VTRHFILSAATSKDAFLEGGAWGWIDQLTVCFCPNAIINVVACYQMTFGMRLPSLPQKEIKSAVHMTICVAGQLICASFNVTGGNLVQLTDPTSVYLGKYQEVELTDQQQQQFISRTQWGTLMTAVVQEGKETNVNLTAVKETFFSIGSSDYKLHGNFVL
jgi:hypothetical protein